MGPLSGSPFGSCLVICEVMVSGEVGLRNVDPERGEAQTMPSGESLLPLLQAHVALRLTLERAEHGF
jgi:hypothetical protein